MAWSKDNRCGGIDYQTLKRRLIVQKKTLEQAFEEGPSPKQSKEILAWEEAKSIKAWARDERCPYTETTIRNKLALGWSNEEAISGITH